jgi:hypothetical protein
MQSTQQEELVLHTYGEGNRRGRANDGGTIWTNLGGGDWLLRWSSGDKNRTNRLPMFPLAPPCFNFSGGRRIELTRQEILGG